MIEQQIANEDLVVISAAVHLYLNPVSITIPQERVRGRYRNGIRLERPKRNRWKWSFFPYINNKGHRDYQWSN
ncbi:MAG: hypothetical protein V1709_02420 [Planctomycetota bacterium]